MTETFRRIYDFESAIETALKNALVATGDFGDTDNPSVAIPGDSPAFQKIRPRVELQLEAVTATDHRQLVAGSYVPDSWTGTVNVFVITNTKSGESDDVPVGDGLREHGAFKALVRYNLDKVETVLTADATLLPYHSVNRLFPSGASPSYKPEDGTIVTQLNYDIHFNVRPTAWTA